MDGTLFQASSEEKTAEETVLTSLKARVIKKAEDRRAEVWSLTTNSTI